MKANLLKVTLLFDGGSYNGKLCSATVLNFKIGMPVKIGGEVYVVQDGPAARCLESTQEECENLAVRCKFAGAVETIAER